MTNVAATLIEQTGVFVLLVTIVAILNIKNSYCTPNIRVQVNNDKLQSAPYLMEAIRHVEDLPPDNNTGNLLATTNYSTILRRDSSTNQMVNLGSLLPGSGGDESSLSSQRTMAAALGVAENHNRDEITESESSNSRLANLLGQPESTVAENLTQSTRKMLLRNQNNNNLNNLNNNANGKTPISTSLPVTSSHLKRPFALTTDDSDRQPQQIAGIADAAAFVAAAPRNPNGTTTTIMTRQEQSAHFSQTNSIVSPSVASDESLAPPSIVRMSDVSNSMELAEHQHHYRFTSKNNYHELDRPAPESWRQSNSNTNNDSQSALGVVYPKASNRSYTQANRAGITVGAGNQLATASGSTLALESSRSTDLSPTHENASAETNRQHDLDLGVNVNNNPGEHNNNENEHHQPINGDDVISESIIVNDNNSNTVADQDQSSASLQRNEVKITTTIRTSGNYSRARYQGAYNDQQNQQDSRDQPIRVIEIPEKIMVTADSNKNDDPIEIMPAPPVQTPPIRIVVNRTRLGRPDPRCPKEGVSTFEHPSACDKYYYCDDGYLIEQTCPNGLMYGTMYRVKDYCVYRWHADCVDKTIPNPISSPGCRWQYGVFSVQGSPKCTPDYYECIAGRFEVKKCSITGQVYDDRTKGCQYAEKVGCPEEIISDFQCPIDDRTNSFWPFPRYYLDTKTIIHCVNDKPRIMRCPEGERVDLERLYCIPMGAKEPVVMDRKVRERQKGTMQPQGKNMN